VNLTKTCPGHISPSNQDTQKDVILHGTKVKEKYDWVMMVKVWWWQSSL